MGGDRVKKTAANKVRAIAASDRLQSIATAFLKMSGAALHASHGVNESVIGPLDSDHRKMLEAIMKIVNAYEPNLTASIGDHLSSPDTLCVITTQWKDS